MDCWLFLIADYAVASDVDAAGEVTSQIQSENWQGQIKPQLERLRMLDPETLAKRLEVFGHVRLLPGGL